MKSVAAILTLYASTVWGANHMVTVGAGGFVFNPTSITAAVGDTVEFVFTGNHSVVSAAFDSPCKPSGEVFSGFSPQPHFVYTVDSMDADFYYCAVDDHCQGGMVFAINPNSTDSLDAFKAAAASVPPGGSVAPAGGMTGGTTGPIPSASSEQSSASAAGPSTAATWTSATSWTSAATWTSATTWTTASTPSVQATSAASSVALSSHSNVITMSWIDVILGVLVAMVALV